MTPRSSFPTGGPRVAVVGAGVLGLMCGWRLAQAGARVTLHEAAPYRLNASGIAAGMIAPAAECAFEPALHAIAPALLAARGAWSGIAGELGVRLAEHGALISGSARDLALRRERLARLGFCVAPAASADGTEAVFAADDALLSAPQAMAALRRAAARAGVLPAPGRVEATRDGYGVSGAALEADVVVLATGAPGRTSGLAPELARLRPIKGQLLRWRNPTGTERPTLRCGDGFYLAVTADEVLAGATMEPDRDDLEPRPAALADHRVRAEALIPALDHVAPTIGVGVRVDTPDGLPMAGFSARPGVVLATAARRNGWLLAPPIAEIVVGLVTGRLSPTLAPLAQRLHPQRFDTKDTP